MFTFGRMAAARSRRLRRLTRQTQARQPRRSKPGRRVSRSALPVCDLPTRTLAAKLQSGQLSASAALEAFLERIEARNPVLNAVISIDVARARKLARAADAAFRRGRTIGPLHGVPIALKDGHEVAGLRTTVGAAEMDHVADADGTVARRLREAGAIVIGHTNVAAWLADPLQTENPIFGRTKNPWNLERVPGGSSGGAAAAVASGLTPFDVGSDLAASVRLPAHFCGVYGLKTTEHRVPLTGFFRVPNGGPRPVRILSTLGPLARDLDDLAFVLEIIAGPDGEDGDVPPVPLGAAPRRPLRALRLAFAPELPGGPVADCMKAAVEETAARAARAGAKIAKGLPDVDWSMAYQLFSALAQTITQIFVPHAALSPEQRTLAFYLQSLERRDEIAHVWEQFLEQHDALIVPGGPRGAFSHRPAGAPVPVEGRDADYWTLGVPYVMQNLTGQPALTVPAGCDAEGMPIGIQIIGRRWSEMQLIEIAHALQIAGVLPGFRAPPLATLA
jgi:amidase